VIGVRTPPRSKITTATAARRYHREGKPTMSTIVETTGTGLATLLSRTQATERGLGRYLPQRCSCTASARFHITLLIARNGAKHYRLRCATCGAESAQPLPHGLLAPNESPSRVRDNRDRYPACEGCGGRDGVTFQHWAVGMAGWICQRCYSAYADTLSGLAPRSGK
jgi:DNA-directed RNA polymerase subunit RPC12/RpoP